MKQIPDLHYVVAKANPVFAKTGHLTVFYRHDKDGNPYIYHVGCHYGDNGVRTRANAYALGRDVVTYKRNMGLRSEYIPLDHRANVRAALKARGIDLFI